MPWEPGPAYGFTTGEPWLPTGDRDGLTVAEQRADPASALSLARDLIALRRSREDLASGAYATIPSPPATWAWRRGERTGVALNLGDGPADIGLTGTVLVGTRRERDGEHVDGTLHPRARRGRRPRARAAELVGRGAHLVRGRPRALVQLAPALVGRLGAVDRGLALLERLALLDERPRLLQAAAELLGTRIRPLLGRRPRDASGPAARRTDGAGAPTCTRRRRRALRAPRRPGVSRGRCYTRTRFLLRHRAVHTRHGARRRSRLRPWEGVIGSV